MIPAFRARTMIRATALVLTAAVTIGVAPAPARHRPAARLDALVALCKLWNAVRFTHPALVDETDARWDDALLAGVPALERDPRSLQGVAAAMLATLRDPYTSVVSNDPAAPPVAGHLETREQVRVVTLGMPAPADADFANRFAFLLGPGPPPDRGLVVDVRMPAHYSDAQGALMYKALTEANVAGIVSATEVTQPPLAQRYLAGFPPEDRAALGSQYVEGRETLPPRKPVPPAKEAHDRPVAFIVNANSYLPPGVAGLVRTGKAAVFSADGNVFWEPGDSVELNAGDGLHAELRTTALAEPLPTSVGDINDAIEWVRAPHVTASVPPAPQTALAERYASDDLPDEPHRILAAFRIWGTIAYLNPYRDLMDDDWDAALRDALGELPHATTRLVYVKTILKMYAHVHDTHGFIGSRVLQAAYAATPRFRVAEIGGRAAIVDIGPGFSRRTGLQPGDVVEAVDGVDTAQRVAQLRPYTNASTEQSLRSLIDTAVDLPGLFSGPLGSTVTVRVRGPRGVRSVRLTRYYYDERLGVPARPIVQVLPRNVGYVDLTRLMPAGGVAALARIATTRALIFDLRGYPHDSIYPLAPHLTAREVPVARFRVPVRTGAAGTRRGPFEELAGSREFREIVAPQTPRYGRPVVVLIDVRAVSAAEHTALYLETAAHARFVGQPTTGANGGVTTMIVPGNLHLHFSGQAVMHADGRRLQRVGIVPDVFVEPTLAGVRAGRDEILEAGVREALRLSTPQDNPVLSSVRFGSAVRSGAKWGLSSRDVRRRRHLARDRHRAAVSAASTSATRPSR